MSIEGECLSIDNEIAYCLQRAKEERTAAARARDVSARESHLQMAERYADRALSFVDDDPTFETVGGRFWPSTPGRECVGEERHA